MFGALLSTGILASSPIMPVGDYFPGVADFRSQKISKVSAEREWPFVAESGLLMCAYVLKDPTVYFVADMSDEEELVPFHISTDMASMAIVNLGTTGVLKPYDSLEQLLVRLHPYVSLGQRLCEQPAGTTVPDTAL